MRSDTSAQGGDRVEANPRAIDYATARTKTWTVGTLVYSFSGIVALFTWLLLGDFALAIRDRSVPPVVQTLLHKYEASDSLTSLLMVVIPPAIGMFIVPIISYRSDRFRSRWGRRIPFMLVPTPVAFLAMVGLAYCPSIGEALHRWLGYSLNASVLASFSVFWTLFEVAVIAAGAVIGGLINDVVPGRLLGRFFGLFRAVSLGAGIIFNRWFFSWAQSHFFEVFMTVGVIFAGGFTLMCFMVREGEYPPPVDDANDLRGRGFLAAAKVYFHECFKLSHYRWIFASGLLAGLTFMPFNSFSIYYSTSVGMDGDTYGRLLAGSYVVSLILAYPLGWMVDRFHPLRVGIVAMAMYVLSTLYGSLFVHDPATFSVALVAHTVLSGTYFTATAALGQALFPKLRFGQFASAGGLVGSLGSIATGLLLGWVLDVSNHNYKLTLVAGLGMSLMSVLLLSVVYRNYLRLGGHGGYVPPEP